jgi:chromosome segregation ATPase
MLAQQNRRGAVAGAVVAVIVLVLVAGGIWYFVSDPFHQKVKDAITGQTKWTPENIKKDPAGYLSWAIDQASATKDKLGTAQLALQKQLNEINDKLEQNKTKVSQFESLLGDMMDAREKANVKNSWPVTVHGVSLETEQQLKDKAVDANGKLERSKTLVETYTKAQSKVQDRLNDIDGQMTKVENLKTKLETDLETAKVQQTFDGIEGDSSKFDDIVHTSDALAQTAEKNASVDDMIKPTGEARVNEEFDKLLQKRKDAGAKK